MKKSYHKNGVSISEFDNKSSFDTKKDSGGKRSGSYPKESAIEHSGHELKKNPPKILSRTSKKFGRAKARKQRIAIMLNKARKES